MAFQAEGKCDPGGKDVDERIRVSRRMLYQEMGQLCYMEIPNGQIHYWKDLTPFGVDVSKRFPETNYDIEQASKCLALDRATSCVFHLMRVLDYALQRLAKRLKVSYDVRDS